MKLPVYKYEHCSSYERCESMPKQAKTSTDTTELLALVAKLEKENAVLKKQAESRSVITFKVSQKRACSVYGLGRLPVTLYKQQWEALLDRKDDLLAFLEEHRAELATKDDRKSTPLADSDSSDSDSDSSE